MILSLFRDYPDLYQALAALSADEDADASDARTAATFSAGFRTKVLADIARLEADISPLPVLAIASAAQWPEQDTRLLTERYRIFITML